MVAVHMQASIPDSKVAVYRRMESTRARKLQHDYAAKENSLSMVRSLRARVMVIEERLAKRKRGTAHSDEHEAPDALLESKSLFLSKLTESFPFIDESQLTKYK